MKRLRAIPIGLLGLSLVAGPVAAACADCCPQEEPEAVFVVPPDCCGDCEPSVAQSKDAVAALAAKAVAQVQSAGPVGDLSLTSSVGSRPLVVAASARMRRPPPYAGTPLRL